jgi:hypothetical protein
MTRRVRYIYIYEIVGATYSKYQYNMPKLEVLTDKIRW